MLTLEECNIMDVHHIVPRSKNGLDLLENLKTYCIKCHKIIEPSWSLRRCTKPDKNRRIISAMNIDEELWRQVRKAAIDKGISARDYFEEALREKLQRDKVRVSNVD